MPSCLLLRRHGNRNHNNCNLTMKAKVLKCQLKRQLLRAHPYPSRPYRFDELIVGHTHKHQTFVAIDFLSRVTATRSRSLDSQPTEITTCHCSLQVLFWFWHTEHRKCQMQYTILHLQLLMSSF